MDMRIFAMSDTWILYQTTNLVNGKIYIGVHKVANTAKSRKYLGSGDGLRAAINKHGRENFTRATLAEFSCADDAYKAEEEMVNKEFISREDIYNMKIGGRGCKGLALTEEHKAKISAFNKGKVITQETKAKIAAAKKGKERDIQTREKISNSLKGKVQSPETRAKRSISCKGNTNGLGYRHTEEAKAKISINSKNCSKETRDKISAAGKGRVFSPETRAKMSASAKGKIVTEEAKTNMRAASPNSKPVIIDDKYYISISQAARFEKIALITAQRRFKSCEPEWLGWRFATEEEIASFLEGGASEE